MEKTAARMTIHRYQWAARSSLILQRAHLYGMINLELRRQQHEARKHPHDPDDGCGGQISENDLAQERRPVKRQERPGAAQHEGADHGEDKNQPPAQFLGAALRRVARLRNRP